jgi:hypothetical protein
MLLMQVTYSHETHMGPNICLTVPKYIQEITSLSHVSKTHDVKKMESHLEEERSRCPHHL